MAIDWDEITSDAQDDLNKGRGKRTPDHSRLISQVAKTQEQAVAVTETEVKSMVTFSVVLGLLKQNPELGIAVSETILDGLKQMFATEQSRRERLFKSSLDNASAINPGLGSAARALFEESAVVFDKAIRSLEEELTRGVVNEETIQTIASAIGGIVPDLEEKLNHLEELSKEFDEPHRLPKTKIADGVTSTTEQLHLHSYIGGELNTHPNLYPAVAEHLQTSNDGFLHDGEAGASGHGGDWLSSIDDDNLGKEV